MAGILYNHILIGFLFSLMSTSLVINPASAVRIVAGSKNTEFIKTSCEKTTYPNLCYTSLWSHASAIGADPQLLANMALTVTLQNAKSTTSTMVNMANNHGLSHSEIGAMRDCVEELRDSIDEIKQSMVDMQQLKGPDFDLKMSDIQTWVSAALTDDDTCMEGFAGKAAVNGNVKTAVREGIVNVAHLTSNALALINALATLHN